MGNVLELTKVSKKYKNGSGETFAVKEVTFALPEGESLAVVGPSGSGKTTLLNIIGALDKPSSGEVSINGENTLKLNDNQLSKFRNKTIGFVFQFFNLQDYFTAQENVALPLIIKGMSSSKAKARARELLNDVGLKDRVNYYPKQLSGGEMQRTAIARSLANDPKILLADEPTANLDKDNALNILSLFNDIGKKGVSVIMITHDPTISAKFSNVLKLKNGEISK